jgi:hypothetical protein
MKMLICFCENHEVHGEKCDHPPDVEVYLEDKELSVFLCAEHAKIVWGSESVSLGDMYAVTLTGVDALNDLATKETVAEIICQKMAERSAQ